ncbi:MAG: ParB/RepB/Spo0J family partition protein, partial [Patescibacteria group bacterium]
MHTIICSSQQEKEGASMETSGQNVVQLLLAEVRPDSEQPRKYFDPDELEELLLSIKENGLRNPIHVKPDTDTGEGYLIVAGERRFRCVTALGETTIRAFVMPANTDALVFGLVDNLNRANLNSMEEAWGYA